MAKRKVKQLRKDNADREYLSAVEVFSSRKIKTIKEAMDLGDMVAAGRLVPIEGDESDVEAWQKVKAIL